MRKPLMVLLAAGILLSACGGWSDSRVNPGNWFGKSRSTPIETGADPSAVNPLIPNRSSLFRRPEAADASVPITKITELRVERTTTGAIILATGVAARQGVFNAELRPDPRDEDSPKDVLSLTFRVVYPQNLTSTGSEHTRTVHEAYSLSTQDLTGIRLIRVKGEQNVVETRRR